MGAYLYYAAKYVYEKYYRVLCLFFRNLRDCLNQNGRKVIEEARLKLKLELDLPRGNSQNTNTSLPYCEVETCTYLPLIGENFLLDFLPRACSEFKINDAVRIFSDFCQWLHSRQLTRIKIAYNN
eukprot:TRINITY_DN6581_c0_g2_i3.p1 TRINITY_DN6581_c0_g2~~TRINITY_DN6581_c0_g2_i3.p1  ORF type:complete len:125 (+),score=20.34 TRINITY_DN6581_c0_g2_i3:243-617(+)